MEERQWRGRVVKVSPTLWDPDLRCRYVERPRGTSNQIRVYCINHENSTSPVPGAPEASFEARQVAMTHFEPVQLGQPMAATPIMVKYDIDTILLMNHCLSTKVHQDTILSRTGFGKDLINSPDWNRIQHLAMEWMKFHRADVLNGYQRVFTKEILMMKGLKTFTLIGTYVRYSSTGPPDSLTHLEGIKTNAQKAGKLCAILKGLDKAFEKTHIKIASDWQQSVREAIRSGKRQGMVQTDFNIPQLRIKTLKMNGGQTIVDWRCAELY
jgi:hypothetical protein